MARQQKYLPDGSPNPRYKKDTSRTKYIDGAPNPRYKTFRDVPESALTVVNPSLQERLKAALAAEKKAARRVRDNQKPHESLFERGEFVAWDGEGVTLEDGTHIYTILANSKGASIVRAEGLTTAECLDFILSECTSYKNAIHVGFVFSYDTAMILADLDYPTVRSIAQDDAPYPTPFTLDTPDGNPHTFSVSYRARKELTVQEIGQPWFVEELQRDGSVKHVKNVLRRARIWDVFGFFQSSFVEAIEKWLGKDYPDLAMIRDGKLHRGTFTTSELTDYVLPYCLAEVKALVALCESLHTALVDAGIVISRWDGAGAIAAAMMTAADVKSARGDYPTEVETAGRHAYFGGRIELIAYGHYLGDVHHYDINSAYPAAQQDVPDLSSGEWSHHTDGTVSTERFSLYHVRWMLADDKRDPYGAARIFPFPFRELGDTVIYPSRGEGWYWHSEVAAAIDALPYYQRHFAGATIEVIESWSFTPASDRKPFLWLREKYDLRRAWKKEGRPAEKVVKLGVNSSYGKTAQNKGYDPKTERKPPFHELLWAGYTTSGARAALFRAAMQAPDAVLFLATDGIFTTTPLDLPLSGDLGAWEYERHDEIVIVQSGVYFHRTGDVWATYQRGFDKGTLTNHAVLAAWQACARACFFPSTRFVGLQSGTINEESYRTKLRRWVSIKQTDADGRETDGRKLSLDTAGTKRRERTRADGTPLWVSTKKGTTPADALIETWPDFNLAYPMMSRPYRRPWDRDDDTLLDGVPADVYETEHDDTHL